MVQISGSFFQPQLGVVLAHVRRLLARALTCIAFSRGKEGKGTWCCLFDVILLIVFGELINLMALVDCFLREESILSTSVAVLIYLDL